MDERPQYRYLDLPQPEGMPRCLAFALPIGLAMYAGLYLVATFLIPRISP